MKNNHFIYAIVIVLFCSCNAEKKIVTHYVEKFADPSYAPTEKIYVVLPQNVIHTNRKLADVEGFNSMNESSQDSIILKNTLIVNKINDSIFLNQFNTHLLYNLSKLGIPVVVTSKNQLPVAIPNQTFIIQIPQIEVEEDIDYKVYQYIDLFDDLYESSVKVNKMNVNVWYLFNKESDSVHSPVYFKNWGYQDRIKGSIYRDMDGKLLLRSTIKEININDAYLASYTAGKTSAIYFVEKIINDYLKSQKVNPSFYYFYNPKDNYIYKKVRSSYKVPTFEKVTNPSTK